MKVRTLKGFANTYIVEDKGEVLIVDPGNPPPEDLEKVKFLFLTHGHFDHYFHAEDWVRTFDKGLLYHEADVPIMENAPDWAMRYFGIPVPPPPKASGYVKEGDRLKVGDLEFTVWEIPGHSPGSVALVGGGIVFVGDLIFEGGGVGRTDLPGGDEEALVKSIRRILSLPDSTLVYPGHGGAFYVRDARRWFR